MSLLDKVRATQTTRFGGREGATFPTWPPVDRPRAERAGCAASDQSSPSEWKDFFRWYLYYECLQKMGVAVLKYWKFACVTAGFLAICVFAYQLTLKDLHLQTLISRATRFRRGSSGISRTKFYV
ncbi:hypothetical protein RRG08_064191 [Elysia crispata]|uniref:Uncharacterized protein n=1 Tax=Elysia crispata TaxID=231223 RepID=A0AAE1DPJ8_9GAST|nr:hypothetical protein RRG08_064191 [Elysia crispata]